MTRLHDQIRDIIRSNPRLTQRGLAERMGLDPAAVNRMLYGRRSIMAEEIPVIEAYLGQRLDLGDTAAAAPRSVAQAPARRGLSDVPQAGVAPPAHGNIAPPAHGHVLPPVPVRDMQGGDTPIDWTPRHPAQAGLPAAFALYVSDDLMAPRYLRGEIIYVHPHRPPAAPQDVIVAAADGRLTLCRLIAEEGDSLRVQFLNPAQEKTIARAGIAALYAVVGRG